LEIPAEFAGMEFDLLELDPMTVNLDLVVNPSQVKKVSGLVNSA
jgi:hypothetical protein